jgi:hypothetical protein
MYWHSTHWQPTRWQPTHWRTGSLFTGSIRTASQRTASQRTGTINYLHALYHSKIIICTHIIYPTTMSKLPHSSSSNAMSRGLFCFQCNCSNFTDDGKGHRSLAQHMQHCNAPTKKSDSNELQNSGTDPFPFLTKKRRIDQSDFNYARQLNHYLEGETLDNIFVGNANHKFSQSSVDFQDVYDDSSPPVTNNSTFDLSLVPMVHSS